MSETEPEGRDTAARVRRGLDYALLGGLVLLGAFAALQFYFAADRTINVWVTREFRPPFKMVFNLVVLLVVGVGLSRQVRRLTGGDDESEPTTTSETTTDGGSVPTEPLETADTTEKAEPSETATRSGAVDSADADGTDPTDGSDRS